MQLSSLSLPLHVKRVDGASSSAFGDAQIGSGMEVKAKKDPMAVGAHRFILTMKFQRPFDIFRQFGLP